MATKNIKRMSCDRCGSCQDDDDEDDGEYMGLPVGWDHVRLTMDRTKAPSGVDLCIVCMIDLQEKFSSFFELGNKTQNEKPLKPDTPPAGGPLKPYFAGLSGTAR